MVYEDDEDVEQRRQWHVGREIPIAVILSLFLMIVTQIAVWYAFKQEVSNFMMTSANQRLEDLATMRSYIESRTDDRIRAQQVHTMFQVRDVQHENLVKQVDRMSVEVSKLASAVNDALHSMHLSTINRNNGNGNGNRENYHLNQ